MERSLGSPPLYLSFSVLVVVMLAVDFLLLRAQGGHKVGVREALSWSLVWVAVAMAFGGWLWFHVDSHFGREAANVKALEYLTVYLIGKSLAVDNVFVWITIFSYFAVPAEYQKRVLMYGVLGAIVMRAVLIFIAALLLARFHWLLYLFGAFLLFTGVKMLMFANREPDLSTNPVLKWIRAHVRVTEGYHGEKFVVISNGLRYATPLLLVLVFVELTDLIFAVDSIPAIFAVTSDPFIVFTSYIFAILGLRAMYFLLADVANRFHLLKHGLAIVLMFIGVKMLLLDVYRIPVGVALAIVFAIIAVSVAASLLTSGDGRRGARPQHPA